MAAALSPLCPHVHSQHHSHRFGQQRLTGANFHRAFGRQKSHFKKKLYLKSKHGGRERKGRSKSPQFGALPSGFGMKEWMSGSDGQGAQGHQSCCHQPSPARGPGLILCLSLELWENPECHFSPSKGTGKQELSHPSASQCVQQSSSHLNFNFCKDLQDLPHCLHGNAVCRNPVTAKADPNGK